MILCGLAHGLWVWTLGPLPQPQAVGQGSPSQEHSLLTPLHGLNSLSSPEKAPTAEVWSRLAQSGPLPWVPRHRKTRPRWGWEVGSAWPGGGWKLSPRPRCPGVSAACLRDTGKTHAGITAPAARALHGSSGTPGAQELGMKPSARLRTLSAD